jgi:hypothetical protein
VEPPNNINDGEAIKENPKTACSYGDDLTFFSNDLTTATNTSWDQYGQELLKSISEKHGLANNPGGQYSKHFGFGNNVVIAGNGQHMAISYEGVAGFDKAFGTHIDIVRYNTSQQQWVLVQTVTDVVRGHGHTQDVKYQSMTFSSNGERLIFADGHGVNVYQHNSTSSNPKGPVKRLVKPM